MTSSLVSTAAAAAAVIPFNCIICFEEFNLQLRFPVVLPCGHTYVCNLCARRLKRCMECREPLFVHASPKPAPVISGSNRGGPPLYPQGRYHQAPSSPITPAAQHSQQQPEPIALPLPKNVVLISMMEAAGSQSLRETCEQDSQGKSCIQGSTQEEEMQHENENEDDDEDEFDLDRIISGMVTFSGPCGTYVVRDPEGLTVLPSHPEKVGQKDDIDVKNKDSFAATEPVSIVRGQTVQVVSFTDGVTKLARGAGYIVATSSQLVKVGAPLDKCCRLEGVVETLALRGVDLQAALSENHQLELHLRAQVEEERQRRPVHPIISDPPETNHEKICAQHQGEVRKECCGAEVQNFANLLLMPHSPREVFVTEASDSSGLELVGEDRLLLYTENGTRLPASPNSIDNSAFSRIEAIAPGIPRYRRNTDDDLHEYGCGAFLNFEYSSEDRVGLSFDSIEGVQQPLAQPRQLESAVQDSEGLSTSPARPLQNQTHVTNFMSSSSFDAVDWRTGMSGHRGLSKTSPRSNFISRTVRMMSEHRGIGSIRASSSRHSNSPSSSPALVPRFVSPNDLDIPDN